MTCFIRAPRSLAPPPIAARTAARISAASTAGGRNVSSAAASASSRSPRSERRAALDPATQHLVRLLIGGGVLQLEFAVFEVCENRGEENRAPLIASFASLIHRGAEPLGHAFRHYAGRRRRFLRFFRSLGFS